MVIVKGSIPVKESQQRQALELVESLARASREEPGCLAYEVYQQAFAPQMIVVWQQWRSLDALERHFDSAHVDAFIDAIPELIDGDVETQRFDVISEDGELLDDDLPAFPKVLLAGDITVH